MLCIVDTCIIIIIIIIIIITYEKDAEYDLVFHY